MKLLAIETSTDACSVGVWLDGEVIADHRLAAQQHAALVLPMIDALMAGAGIDVKQLDGIVYGQGPGSFTGVRIGVALTQGIALGADVGVIGISTLQSMAHAVWQTSKEANIAVSLDARMGEVYFATYAGDDRGQLLSLAPECVCPPDKLVVPHTTQPWIWAGSGAEQYAEILRSQYSVEANQIAANVWPHAENLLALALPRVMAGELRAAEDAMPVYLRNKVAQTTAEREAAKGQPA